VNSWRSPQQRDVSENENDRYEIHKKKRISQRIFFSITVERQINGVRLRIRNLTTEDQGVWECFGTDEDGQQIKKSFQMLIKGLFYSKKKRVLNKRILFSSNYI
jgi:hypothetical protein